MPSEKAIGRMHPVSLMKMMNKKGGITMKKTYVKPALYVETFEMTQSIAGGCSVTSVNFSSEDNCTWEVMGMVFFNADPCVPNSAEFNFVCYNNPEGAQTILFDS